MAFERITVRGREDIILGDLHSIDGGGTDKSWLIAEPYRLEHRFDMVAVHPAPNETDDHYSRWADTYTEYNVRLCIQGGEPPFRFEILEGPDGCFLGNGGKVQTFTRTPSAEVPNMYIHTLPQKYAQLRWKPTADDIGYSGRIVVSVKDQGGQVLIFNIPVTVDNSRFRYISENGSDAANGMWGTPYKSVSHVYSLANTQGLIFKFLPGTYPITEDIALSSSKCKSWIGVSENSVYFQLFNGVISAGGFGVTFKNINLEHGNITAANARLCNWSGITSNFHSSGCVFNQTFSGNIGTDNPAGTFFVGVDPQIHENVSVVDFTVADSNLAQITCFFSVVNSLVENGKAVNATNYVPSNGNNIVHFKHACRNATIRFCDFVSNADHLVSFANQNPSLADKQEAIFNRLVRTDPSAIYWPLGFNIQPTGAPYKGTNQWAERNTIYSATNAAIGTRSNGTETTGTPVNVAGNVWTAPGGLKHGNEGEGGVVVGVNNYNAVDARTLTTAEIQATLGVSGAVIASTLVS